MLDGASAAVILDTQRRIGQIRTPLVETFAEGHMTDLGGNVAERWYALRDAFIELERAIAAVTPKGAPYLEHIVFVAPVNEKSTPRRH